MPRPRGLHSSLNYVIILLILSILVLAGCNTSSMPSSSSNDTTTSTTIPQLNTETRLIKIKEQTYQVYLAQTSEEITLGLMNRSHLPTNQGALFLFPDSVIRHFWMKNTLIPLDIIFLDHNNTVINIHHNTPPCHTVSPDQTNCPNYSSTAPSQTVLELNAGQAKLHNITTGDIMELL